MFAAGAVHGTLALAGWFFDLLGDFTGWYRPLELNIPEAWAHGYLMVYGFFPFFMFGFLMTALPNWVGQEKPTASNFVPSAGLMFVGVVMFYGGILLFEPLIYFGVALQLGGWLVGLSGLVRRVRAAEDEDLRHPVMAILGLAVGAMGLLVFNFAMVAHEPGAARLALWAGVWMFLLPVFLTIAHRMIPFFSSRVLSNYRVVRPYWALWVLVAAAAVHGTLMIAGVPQLSWIADLTAFAVSLYLVIVWRIDRCFEDRLLAVLHLAFAWVPVAFALSAVQTLSAFLGQTIHLALAPTHALAVGFFSSMLIAMATRVTLGHSGRPLKADLGTWILFLGMMCAALLRVLADTPLAGEGGWALLLAAGALWVLSFGFWTARNLPIYLTPRPDGMPG
jgi:uncharacterized protein involved in response to NO